MKANATQIRAAIDKLNPDTRLYLFHGPDEAGAADLASRLGKALGPEAERIDLDMKALREQPGRLADEAASMSLFGGTRYVRVLGVEEGASEAISLLLAAQTAGNPVVAIGPGLKASGKLVKSVIAAQNAWAHACYVPEGVDATRLASNVAREHGLRLMGDVPSASPPPPPATGRSWPVRSRSWPFSSTPRRTVPRMPTAPRSTRSAPTWAIPT